MQESFDAELSPASFKIKFAAEHPVLSASGELAAQKVVQARQIMRTFKDSSPEAAHIFGQVGSEEKEELSPFGDKEYQQLREMLLQLSPVTINNYQAWMNANAAAHVARELATRLGVNPNLVAGTALLQNVMRTITEGQFNRDFLVAKSIFIPKDKENTGLRSDLLRSLVSPTELSATALSNEKKIVALASLVGKIQFDQDGVPQRAMNFEEAIRAEVEKLGHDSISQLNLESYQVTALTGTKAYEKWLSEKKLTPDTPHTYERFIREIHSELIERGIQIDEIQMKAERDKRDSTPAVLMLDLGGLVQESPGILPMVPPLARIFGMEEAAFKQRWEALYGAHHRDFTTPESFIDDVRRNFLGETYTMSESTIRIIRDIYIQSLNPTVDPAMLKVIAAARERKVSVVAFTDTSPDHAELNIQHGVYERFDRVIRSDLIGGTKGSRRAFMVPVAMFDLAAQSFIFVDDNANNVANAEAVGMHGIIAPPLGQLDQILPEVDRLLQK